MPEGIVDDDDNDSDTASEQTEDTSKVATTQVITEVINCSSSEDLLETEDSDGQCSEEQFELEQEQLETDQNVETVPVVADKGPCFEERLKLAQPIWYLPHINRATVVHYLQGKTVGVFIVRT